MVQKVVQRPQLGQLMDHDAHLKWAVNGYFVLSAFGLTCTSTNLKVIEPHRAQHFVDHNLVFGVDGLGQDS